MCYRDARLSHTGNGIYGEMWAAALVAAALGAQRPDEALRESRRHVPRRSRLAEALARVMDNHRRGLTWDAALADIQRRYGHYGWVHSVNNACLVAAALLWGDGDFAATVGLAVQGGWDTDCNGATAGSVMGAVLGAAGIPGQFSEPLEDSVRPGLFGCGPMRISELACRTVSVATHFHDL
jgi:ADP-ribosylglycohydrolase